MICTGSAATVTYAGLMACSPARAQATRPRCPEGCCPAFWTRARRYAVLGVELEQYWVDVADGCDCTGAGKADWLRYFQPGTDCWRRHIALWEDVLFARVARCW